MIHRALKDYFVRNYGPLKGSDWLKDIPEWERQAFSYVGRSAADWGRLGGQARARTAKRVPPGSREGGRFAPNEG